MFEPNVCFIVSREPLMRQAARRDAIEKGLVRDLRKLGYHVTFVSGDGLPDILVRRRATDAQCFGFECKTAKGKRTDAQKESQWPIVRSLEDVFRLMGVPWHPSWQQRQVL